MVGIENGSTSRSAGRSLAETATRALDAQRAVDERRASFKERQRALKDAYKEQPELGKQLTVVHSVTPHDAETGKVRIAIDGPAGVVVDIGAHVSVGGTEDTGCSGDFLLASLAGCYEVTLRLVAAASKVTINRLDLRVEGEWDARGTLGFPDVPVAYTAIRILVDLDADGPEERIARLAELTERYCVVSQTLKTPPTVEITWDGTID
jgi:uncharacterized OsmC-like protein